MLRRGMILIALLLLTLSASIYAARRVGAALYARLPYDCVTVVDVRVGPNAHLERDVPHVIAASISPDGAHALQLWGNSRHQVIRLQDRQTGHTTLLQQVAAEPVADPVARTATWKWSDDSQYVFYDWQNSQHHLMAAVSSQDAQRVAAVTLPQPVRYAFGFSADDDYVALVYGELSAPQTLAIISTRDAILTTPVTFTTATDLHHTQGAWSPSGHRLAVLRSLQLVAVDPEGGVFDQVTYPALIPSRPKYFKLSMEPLCWSADARYVAFRYWDNRENLYFLDLFAVDGVTLHSVETLPMTSNEAFFGSKPVYHWSQTGHRLIYLKSADPQFMGVFSRARLWQFDPDIRQSSVLVDGIHQFWFEHQTYILVRELPDQTILELRDADGAYPVVVKTFDVKWADSDLDWFQIAQDLSYHLFKCDFPGRRLDRLVIDERGVVGWNLDVQPGAEIIDDSSWFFVRCPYTSRMLRQGEQLWLEVGDLVSETFYEFPGTMHHYPPQYLDNASWDIVIVPSPDGQSWLVQPDSFVEDNIYRFQPAQGTWSSFALDLPSTPTQLTWSPDSRWVAFTRWLSQDQSMVVFAARADGSDLRRLGPVPSNEPLTWDKCGGIGTILGRD